MEKRIEGKIQDLEERLEKRLKTLEAVVDQRASAANRAKSNMERRLGDIEVSIKTLTSVVERLTETVKKTVDKLKMERTKTARAQFLAHDRIERERYDVLQSLQTRIGGIEQQLYHTPDRTQNRQAVETVYRPIPVISGNQIGKRGWGDMGTSDPPKPPSPKRRRTKRNEAERPPTPGIGGKQIHSKNKDQFKSDFKFNIGETVMRFWKPKRGEHGVAGMYEAMVVNRRRYTNKPPKYTVKWLNFGPEWEEVQQWVVENKLQKKSVI